MAINIEYLVENATQTKDANEVPVNNVFSPGVNQVLDGTSASVQSTAFSVNTIVELVNVSSTLVVYYAVGTDPTASSTQVSGGALTPYSGKQFRVSQGEKVAVRGAVAHLTTQN